MTYLPITPKKLQEALDKAVKSWHKESLPDSPLLQLRVVQQALPDQQGTADELAKQLAIKKVLRTVLEKLESTQPDLHKVVQTRFIDDRSLKESSEILHKSIPTIARHQNEALLHMKNTLVEMEYAAANEIAEDQELDLPKRSYTKLFGVEDTIEELTSCILSPEKYHMLALIGIGGIGKSSLAREVASRIIRSFYFTKVLWVHFSQDANNLIRSPEAIYAYVVSQIARKLIPDLPTLSVAEQEKLIKPILKSVPHLIVIDNLEIESDIDPLVEELQSFTNPSKILFGSRARPSHPMVYRKDVNEISYADSCDFMRYLTELNNSDNIPDSLFAEIYEAIGGNPLAIILVITLLQHLPFSELLPTIKDARQESHKMYTRIYERIWSILSDDAKELLYVLTTISLDVGFGEDGLAHVSGLDREAFWAAMRELRFNSLLAYQGTAAERAYSIHRLTETFVVNDVVKLFD